VSPAGRRERSDRRPARRGARARRLDPIEQYSAAHDRHEDTRFRQRSPGTRDQRMGQLHPPDPRVGSSDRRQAKLRGEQGGDVAEREPGGYGRLLTQGVALIAVLGALCQVLAYVLAGQFTREFGIDPALLGITPLNAAFKMRHTWILLAGVTLLAVSLVLLVRISVGLLAARVRDIENTIAQVREKDKQFKKDVGHIESAIKLPVSTRGAVKLEESLVSRTVADLEKIGARRWRFLLAPDMRTFGRMASALLIGASPFALLFSEDAGHDAARAFIAGHSTDGGLIDAAVARDLIPPDVFVQWLDEKKMSVTVALLTDPPAGLNSTVRVAYLLGTANGFHVLLLDNKQTNSMITALVPTADILLTFVPR
jgi:hypothetical protein